MKKILSIILSIVIIFSFAILPASSADTAKGKELAVVFTHDLHSYIDTREFKKDGKTIQTGGFAKIKTIIDSEKAKNENTLVVDGGDFSMGTLFQSVYTSTAIELRMLGLMGYDATTFGNHEFDYSGQGLAKMLTSAKSDNDKLPFIVSNNINWNNSNSKGAVDVKKAMDDYGVADYKIVKKGNVKIAIFGGMGIDSIEYTPNSGLDFDSFLEKSKETVEKIKSKENPDIIVCLSHGGISDNPKESEDEILAAEIPDIDIIVSGHTHSTLEKPRIVGTTVIGSAGEYGKNVGTIKVKQNKDGSWELEKYKLIPVNEKIVSEAELAQTIEEYRKSVNTYLGDYGYEKYSQVIANSNFDFSTVNDLYANHADQDLSNLITDSYIYAIKQAEGDKYVPIDVAVLPVGVVRSTFYKGSIKVSDVYEVCSLGVGSDGKSGYPLASVYLTGKELKTIAEVDASISTIMSSAQLYTTGLQYTFNPNRLFLNRVTDVCLLTKNGEKQEIKDDKLYRVVADVFSAQMLGSIKDKSFGLLSIVPKDASGNPISDLSKTVIYDKNGSEVKQWYSLASYLQSFEKENGLPTIPAKYENAQGRKIVNDSNNIVELLKSPNKIFFIVLAVVVLLVVIVALIVITIVKVVKKRKLKAKDDNEKSIE
ncbi:MAG: bifunctional UDP-sugar hydrolase/5'-nucleotidase [Oscillospiraceae bacterium]